MYKRQGQPGPAGASSAGLAAYGGMYNSSTQLLAFTAVNAYVRLQLNTLMPMKNVTAGTNQLTIQNEGDYEINYNLLVNTNRAVDVAAVVRNNGTPITQTRAVQTLAIDNTTTLAYDGRLNCSCLLYTSRPAAPLPKRNRKYCSSRPDTIKDLPRSRSRRCRK